MEEEKDKKKLTLYDCATLFAESMHEQFPGGCPEGTSIFMVATNGKTLAYLMEGPDEKIIDMIAKLSVSDGEILAIIGEGVVRAVNHLKNRENGTDQITQ